MRRETDELEHLEQLLDRMDSLGRDGEDAAARVTYELQRLHIQSEPLLTAISDAITVIAERSRLAHQAYRVIKRIRRAPKQSPT